MGWDGRHAAVAGGIRPDPVDDVADWNAYSVARDFENVGRLL